MSSMAPSVQAFFFYLFFFTYRHDLLFHLLLWISSHFLSIRNAQVHCLSYLAVALTVVLGRVQTHLLDPCCHPLQSNVHRIRLHHALVLLRLSHSSCPLETFQKWGVFSSAATFILWFKVVLQTLSVFYMQNARLQLI